MKEQSGGSISMMDILGVALMVLKLCGVIKWSWIWVLSPFWYQLVLFVVIFIIFFIIKMWERKH